LQWEQRAVRLATRDLATRFEGSIAKDIIAMKADCDKHHIEKSEQTRLIQEANKLHEKGEFTASTALFEQLAEAGNLSARIVYGLALLHGWGIASDRIRGVRYFASTAYQCARAQVEIMQDGLRHLEPASRPELKLAIFELGNCFRHGWGVKQAPLAAREYYETAANLGDVDAMNEAAWCFLNGFGGKKDKILASKYYRLAEKNGGKTMGNSWIWKDKYNPGPQQRSANVR